MSGLIWLFLPPKFTQNELIFLGLMIYLYLLTPLLLQRSIVLNSQFDSMFIILLLPGVLLESCT